MRLGVRVGKWNWSVELVRRVGVGVGTVPSDAFDVTGTPKALWNNR